ncbi:hypothetical protein ACFQQB_63235 [Nonomuraea rubra]|uniref:hypothetical protein n=1 Tax=Nonomuraea rubra TaxID=46180 RepID=UPI00360B7982
MDDLGTTLLELVAGDVDQREEISGLVIYDPLDEPVLGPRSLVLGIGVDPSGDTLPGCSARSATTTRSGWSSGRRSP